MLLKCPSQSFADVSSGLMTYVVINTIIWLIRLASGGRLEAADWEMAEPWNWNPQGGTPPWFVRAVKNHGRFWTSPEKGENQDGIEETGSDGGKISSMASGEDKQIVKRVEGEVVDSDF
jgi:hypothetical protein